MARIRPFPSGRPPRKLASRVASVPYDVVDTREARALAAGNPVSFLHVCRPEIDLPEDVDIHSEAVYAKGRENLDGFYANGTLESDPVPRLLVYRQTWRGRKQDGLVATCSVDDYDADVIRKHEKTRPDKEDDRVRHLLAPAARARAVLKGKLGTLPDEHPVNWFPAAIFPDRELAILPYNRVVKDLGGLGKEDFLRKVRERFDVRPAEVPEPRRRGEFSLLFEEIWQTLTPREPVNREDPIASLDVSLLQDRLLAPVLGIGDPRTDPRVDFVGGIRGTGELEERVRSGRGAVAFSIFPTPLAEVMAIADAGATMPPKSTWFEPKLRSGLFVHRF